MASDRKKIEASMDPSNPSNIQDNDVLLVLHRPEINTLKEVLYKALEKPDYRFSNSDIRNILNIINHIEEE